MARVWNADIDLTFKETDSPKVRHDTIAAKAWEFACRNNMKRVNVMMDGAIRVEVQITNDCVRIMECVAEIPFKRSIL